MELDEPVGRNCGRVGGHDYFLCGKRLGVLLSPNRVTLITPPPSVTSLEEFNRYRLGVFFDVDSTDEFRHADGTVTGHSHRDWESCEMATRTCRPLRRTGAGWRRGRFIELTDAEMARVVVVGGVPLTVVTFFQDPQARRWELHRLACFAPLFGEAKAEELDFWNTYGTYTPPAPATAFTVRELCSAIYRFTAFTELPRALAQAREEKWPRVMCYNQFEGLRRFHWTGAYGGNSHWSGTLPGTFIDVNPLPAWSITKHRSFPTGFRQFIRLLLLIGERLPLPSEMWLAIARLVVRNRDETGDRGETFSIYWGS